MMKRQVSGASDAASAPVKRAALTPEVILKHQNRELGLAVKRAQEELKDVKSQLRQLENDRDGFDATTSVLDRAWRLLHSDIVSLAQSVGISDLDHPSAAIVESELNGSLIPASSKLASMLVDKGSPYVLSNVADPSNLDEEEDDDDSPRLHVDLEASLKERIAWTTSLIAKLVGHISKGNINEETAVLHAQVHSLEAKSLALITKLKLARRRIRELTEELDHSKGEIWRLGRRLNGFETGDFAAATRARSDEVQSIATGLNDEEQPVPPATPGIPTPNVLHPSSNGSSEDGELKSRLEDLSSLAASRAEELAKLRDQVKQLMASSRDGSNNRGSHSAMGESETHRALIKERQAKDALAREADRAISVSRFALDKLRDAEKRILELESASDALTKAAEATLHKENARLNEVVNELKTQLDSRTAELEAVRSSVASAGETKTMLKLVAEERDALIRKLNESKRSSGDTSNEESESLIVEIEQLMAAQVTAQESVSRLQQLLTERDKRVSELMVEKISVESDARELREEKNALALRSEKMQSVLKENEAYVARLEDRLIQERTMTQRAEEMAKASAEACDKAIEDRERLREEAEAERERAATVTQLEEELKQTRIQVEELKWRLTEGEEEIGSMKRKVDRAKEALKQANKTTDDLAGSSGMNRMDEILLAEMTKALRCPVYPQFWRDCVITKCAHTFSRRALEENLAQRNRKCPSCKAMYNKDDILPVYLYRSNDY